MEKKFVEYLHNNFALLIEKYNFIKVEEVNDEQEYWIKYQSQIFTIKLEKYRREFYASLNKTGNSDKAVELFNLLRYLNRASANVPMSNYFKEEKDIDECYRKQLNYLSTTIYNNLGAISDFFDSRNLELELAEIRKFMLNKYPTLFKTVEGQKPTTLQ